MKKYLKNLKMKPWFRRSVRGFALTFVGITLPGLLGWLNDLTGWATSQGQRPFPDAHNLGFLAVSAISAGFVAILTGLVTKGEDLTGHGFFRTVTPMIPDPDAVPPQPPKG